MLNSLDVASNESTWLDKPVAKLFRLNVEFILFGLILILAFATRVYDLESRVMSHDETSHVYFSWLFYRGQGYAHDPVTHGPLQFHLLALSYFLFGDSDLTARIPAILFSIATVAFAWGYRRYLGRTGALVAALMLVVSPFLLYYGRYVRNEAFVGLFFMINLWSVLRYLETGQNKFMYFLTLATTLHFATKETSFIYAAQTLLFLGLLFIYRITQIRWDNRPAQSRFLIGLIIGILLFTGAIAVLSNKPEVIPEVNETTQDLTDNTNRNLALGLLGLSGLSIAFGLYYLLTGYGTDALRKERSFSMMLVLFTLILPHLAPFGINFLGWKVPVNASEVNNMQIIDILRMAAVIIPMTAAAIGVGFWWNRQQWLINAGIFYSIFIVLFTTFFTNGAGFFTGLVGSLGYWLAQQDVQRGSQPFYYYLFIQIPIYEFLPLVGTVLAVIIRSIQAINQDNPPGSQSDQDQKTGIISPPVFELLLFWAITSIVAFSVAGEKMPWLTYHIALPMILLSAWGINQIIEFVDWSEFRHQYGVLVILLLPIFVVSTAAAAGTLLGPNPPFQGQQLEQLSATSTFVTAILAAISSAIALGYWMRNWRGRQAISLIVLVVLGFLFVLTARAGFRAAYVNYDNATEFLVYAHSGPGVKVALSEIEELSKRTTGTLDIVVAYDNDTTYPYWWYLRNYPNYRYYGGNPSRDLRDAPVILVGDTNFGKIEPIVGKSYNQFNFIRIWWPNQDYFDLTWERFWNAIRDPQMRAAIFKIWLNRDYSEYAQLTGKDMDLSNWYPSGRMRLYVRKDISSQIWEYGSAPQVNIEVDPYEGKEILIAADKVIGSEGTQTGQFKKPRSVAVAPDGSIYIADTDNHRIQHFDSNGTIISAWGEFADASQGNAPGGTFNEPWGIAVGPDGSVYVADTWNHRVQKFSASGEFLMMWGMFGQAETPQSYWGPRGISVDPQGRVFVTDTGNKRVVVFDSQGVFITEFGLAGYLPGEFNEPVGIAISDEGIVYVADTWNQRVQALVEDLDGNFQPLRSWDFTGWYGQSLENKPYLAVNSEGHIFVSDPESYRIVEFDAEGNLIRYWGEIGTGADGLNLPTGIAIEADDGVWVADSGNHRILHFTLP